MLLLLYLQALFYIISFIYILYIISFILYLFYIVVDEEQGFTEC